MFLIYIEDAVPDRYGNQGAVNILDAPVRFMHAKG